jgi:hypothetical protein
MHSGNGVAGSGFIDPTPYYTGILTAIVMHSGGLLVFFALVGALRAQSPPIDKVYNAGGRWTYHISKDKFTDRLDGIFELKATEPITDGVANGLPTFIIMCGGTVKAPKWINSKLLSPVVLGRPDPPSHSQQAVRLRADGKFHLHAWTMAEDFRVFFVDKGATREVLGSTDARIEFRDASAHIQVAIFSPAGINQVMLTKACGNAFK